MAEPERLCSDPTSKTPTWAEDPTRVGPPRVALEHFQHQVIRQLVGRGLTPKQLSETLGQSEQSWRYKLSGSRRITLEDLLALTMAIDHTLTDLPPLRPDTLRDLIPAAYWDWLSHTDLDRGMPRFERPSPWPGLAKAIDEWWATEIAAGREWAITRDVATHRLLTAIHATGLTAAAVTLNPEADQPTLEWLAEDTRLHLHWLPDADVTGGRLSSGEARTHLQSAATQLWTQATSANSTKILAVAAPLAVRENLHSALLRDSVTIGDPDTWHIIGLTQRQRLGLITEEPDIAVQQLHRSEHAPIDWYRVK